MSCCRRRTTPPSLRFLGPKVYLAAVMMLVTALRCGLNERRSSELQQLVGASRRTLERWRQWWHELLPATPFFCVVRASISEVSVAQLLASLLEHFEASDELTRIVRLLDFEQIAALGVADRGYREVVNDKHVDTRYPAEHALVRPVRPRQLELVEESWCPTVQRAKALATRLMCECAR